MTREARDNIRPPPTRARRVSEALAVAMLYFLAARVGVLLAMKGSMVTPVWPPSGIALAAVLLLGARVWPGIWLGTFAATLLGVMQYAAPVPLWRDVLAAGCTAAGSTLTALLGAWLLRWCIGPRHPLTQAAGIFALLGLGGAVACLLSAAVGTLSLAVFGLVPWSIAGKVWLTWWLGDAAGVIVFTPLILAWAGPLTPVEWQPPCVPATSTRFELPLGFALLFALAWLIFLEDAARMFETTLPAFLLFPLIVWLSVRFGPRGATLAAALVATLAVLGTAARIGPFRGGTINESLLLLELFLCMLVLVALTLAATISERTGAQAALAATNAALDERVRERTGELRTAVDELRHENARRAEAESRRMESDTLYKALFEQSGDAILLLKMDEPDAGRIISANARAAVMHGYAESELRQLTLQDLSTAEDAARVPERLRELEISGVTTFEVGHRRKDGSTFSVEVAASAVVIGGHRYALSVDRDITERRRAEAAARHALAEAEQTRQQLLSLLEDQKRSEVELRNSEAELRRSQSLLRRVLDATPVIIFAKGADSRVLFANEAMAKFYGVTPAEVTGRLQSELHAIHDADPADIAKWLADDRAVMAAGRPLVMEEQGTDSAGNMHWFSTRKYPFEFLPGQMGVLVSSEDITERRAANEALRQTEERLRLALEAAQMGTFDWDIQRNRLTWSHWHEVLWGFQPGEFGGTYAEFAERVHRSDLPGIEADITRCIAAREHFNREFRVVWPDGSVHWIQGQGEFTCAPDGQAVRMLGAVFETTGRRQAEETLRMLSHRLLQAEDEERRRIARELHDSTAQDLVAAMLNLGLLQEQLDPREQKAAELIADSVALIENSATDIRTLSYVVHPPRLDETGLAGALAEFAAGFSQRADIRVRIEMPPDFGRLPAPVETALFRVVQESLANVLRHSQSDTASIRLAKTEDRVMLEVADQGRGLPHALREKHPGACGVGLVSMRERVQYFGGTLELESSSHGTVVRATLPLKNDPT